MSFAGQAATRSVRSQASPAPAPATPAWLAEVDSWPTLTAQPFSTQHLARDHWVEVRVSPSARASYLELGPDSELPDKTTIVELSRDAVTGKPGPVFALEQRSGTWWFWLLSSDGSVQRDGADVAPCAGCHAAAPAPPLFGLPRGP